jgi:ankyrin repeat protein
LLKNGADPNLVNSRGWTAYSYAMKNNHLEIAKLLEDAMQKQN